MNRALMRAVRAATAVLSLVVLLAVVGATWQELAERRDRGRFPPPGVLVEVDGVRLHLHLSGERQDGPVVILEAGGGSFSAQWAWVQPAVAEFARVVSWDRPGLGWSGPATEPLDGTRIAELLHAALGDLGIRGPYVHVGHSVGSPLGRAFAQRFPGEVVGMVKVDPRYLRTEEYLGDGAARAGENMKRWLPMLARLGVPRLLNGAADLAAGLPQRQREVGVAFFSSTAHLRGMASEWDMGNRTTDALEVAGEHYGDIPIVILSSGRTDREFDDAARQRFTGLQAQMTALSSRAEHRMVDGANHYTIVTDRAHAAEVVAAIRTVLNLADTQFDR